MATATATAGRPRVFLDVSVAGTPAGRVVCELRADATPKTCENFQRLCVGEAQGVGYAGSPVHRIIPGFMLQGGDFTAGDGTGGRSVWGGKFADESFALKHDAAGVLSMANAGPNTNGSQFFITLAPTPWLDGKHVVFGRVVAGMDVVRKLDALGTPSGAPKKRVVIDACGMEDAGAEVPRTADDVHRALRAAEAAAAPEDPDAASARRLAEMALPKAFGSGGGRRGGTGTGSARAQAASGAAAEAPAAAAAAAPPAAAVAPPEADGQRAVEEEPSVDVDTLSNMSARERKLFELRLKLNQSRKANHAAVVAEKKRKDNPNAGAGDGGGKRLSKDEADEKRKEGLRVRGIDPAKQHLAETMESASQRKVRGGGGGDSRFGWNKYNNEATAKVAEKRSDSVLQYYSVEEYEANKGSNPALYAGADNLEYGHVGAAVPEENIDRMVNELKAVQHKKSNKSRRRAYHEDKDIDSINDRNANFNKKIERAFGAHTQEIKANLERGTALPDN